MSGEYNVTKKDLLRWYRNSRRNWYLYRNGYFCGWSKSRRRRLPGLGVVPCRRWR